MELLTGLKEQWYKPDDKDDAEFLLAPMDQLTWIDMDALSGSGDMAEAVRRALNTGLKDWKNIKLEGKDAKFNAKLIGKIPRTTLYKLYTQINEISSITEKDEKN